MVMSSDSNSSTVELRLLKKQLHLAEAEAAVFAEEWFQNFDENHDGKLDRDEIQLLLAHVYPDLPPATPESINLLLEKLGAVDDHDDVVAVIVRYGCYICEKQELDAVFQEFDHNDNGVLDKSELQQLLAKVHPTWAATPSDVAHILSQCDENNDGVLQREELLLAVASWKETVSKKKHRVRKCDPRACGTTMQRVCIVQ